MVEEFEYEGVPQTCASLIETGSYRFEPCFSRHDDKGYEVHFCDWEKVDEEMEWYCTMWTPFLQREKIGSSCNRQIAFVGYVVYKNCRTIHFLNVAFTAGI
jgi:hypothetical protein